jgi:hypothetical protein
LKYLGQTSRLSEETGIPPGWVLLICVKNNFACSELWVDDEFEIIAVEVKGSDPKCTWEIVGNYRAPNEDIWVIEKVSFPNRLSGKLYEAEHYRRLFKLTPSRLEGRL